MAPARTSAPHAPAARIPSAGTPRPHNRIRIGYARVSTREQEHDSQLDDLNAAHCREIIIETASTRGDRPQLRAALDSRVDADHAAQRGGSAQAAVRGRAVHPARQAGADLALECGMDQDEKAMALYRAGRFEAVLARYEELSRPGHLLRVQAAFLQLDEAEAEQHTTVKRTLQRRRRADPVR